MRDDCMISLSEASFEKFCEMMAVKPKARPAWSDAHLGLPLAFDCSDSGLPCHWAQMRSYHLLKKRRFFFFVNLQMNMRYQFQSNASRIIGSSSYSLQQEGGIISIFLAL